MRSIRLKLISGISLQLVMTAAAVLQQIVLVRIFVTNWSDDLYRAWLVMFAISNLLIIADLGMHSQTYLRLQEVIAHGPDADQSRLAAAIGNSMRAYAAILVLLTGGIGVFVLVFPDLSILGIAGAPDRDLRAALLLFLLTGAAMVGISCLSAMMRAADKLDRISLVKVLLLTLSTAGVAAAVVSGAGIVAAAFALFATHAVILLWMALKTVPAALPAYHVSAIRSAEKNVRTTLGEARRYIVPTASEVFLQNIPVVIMGLIATPAAGVVAFTLARVITSFVRQVAVFSTYPFAPVIGHHWVRDEKSAAADAVITCVGIVGAGVGSIIGYFAAFHAPVVTIWTSGDQTADPVLVAILLGNVAMAFPAMIAFTALVYTDRPGAVSRARLLQLALLCFLCVVLGLVFEERGIAGAVFLSELLAVSIPLAASLRRAFTLPVARLAGAITLPFMICFACSVISALIAIELVGVASVRQFFLASALWLPLPLGATLAIFLRTTRDR